MSILSFDQNGNVSVQLPSGLSSNLDSVYITVKIYDNLDCVTLYNILNKVTVTVDSVIYENLLNSILNNDLTSTILHSTELTNKANFIISFSSFINQANQKSITQVNLKIS